MKKTILTLGSVLALSGMLVGCKANSAANYPNGVQNVNYRTQSAAPAPTPINNGNYSSAQPNLNQQNYQANKTLSKQIADQAASVAGVTKAHVVVSSNNVLIGLQANKGVRNLTALRKSVYRSVKPLAGSRRIYITTDRRYVTRITNLESRFNAGKGMREFRADVTGIIDDLSHALKRPFQNNAK